MERERHLAGTFVELAEQLVGDYAVEDFLHLLVERCGELVGAAAVGVMLSDEYGSLRIASASTEDMRALELLEMQQQQGPCYEAYDTGEQVIEADISGAHDRWPDFTPRALDLELRSVHAFPMRLRGQTIGALNVFFHEPGGFDEIDIHTLQALADVATIAIVQERAGRESSVLAGQLQQALDSRVVIEQAKGILAGEDEDLNAAFVRLRSYSRDRNLRLRDVAQHVVEHRSLPD
ncbi:MAG: GAF and ANTAR domain-containing protein [Actinobacteria bacterium]|nr:GAF and ANTAR domain-containing protein [Actinomycetota bacterium]